MSEKEYTDEEFDAILDSIDGEEIEEDDEFTAFNSELEVIPYLKFPYEFDFKFKCLSLLKKVKTQKPNEFSDKPTLYLEALVKKDGKKQMMKIFVEGALLTQFANQFGDESIKKMIKSGKKGKDLSNEQRKIVLTNSLSHMVKIDYGGRMKNPKPGGKDFKSYFLKVLGKVN